MEQDNFNSPSEYPAIADLVPHEAPMVLLDRVLSVDKDSLCAEVEISNQSLFYERDGVGSWVGVEYMAQAIAAHAGFHALQRGELVKVGFLLGTRRYEVSVPTFLNGSKLIVKVQCSLQGDNGLGAFECVIAERSKPELALARATITVFQPDNVTDFFQGEGAI